MLPVPFLTPVKNREGIFNNKIDPCYGLKAHNKPKQAEGICNARNSKEYRRTNQ